MEPADPYQDTAEKEMYLSFVWFAMGSRKIPQLNLGTG